MPTKPIPIQTLCPRCQAEAVGHTYGRNAVYWCADGHVVVKSPEEKSNWQVVYDFKKEVVS